MKKYFVVLICLAVFLFISASAGAQQVLYAVDKASNLYTLNPVNGNQTLIGPMGVDYVSALSFQPGTGVLFATTGGNSSNPDCLYTVNTSTGAATLVGCTVLGTVRGMDFHSNGTLYAVISGNLATMNTATGAGIVIGPIAPSQTQASAIDFAPGDVLYHSGGWENSPPGVQFSTLNQSTGAGTILSNATFSGFPPFSSPPVVNSISFDENGNLYGVVREVSGPGFIGDATYLAAVNPATGVVTHIGALIDGMTGLTWDPSAAPVAVGVPTMTNWGMIAFIILAGFVSVLYLRRRSKI